MGSMSIKTLRWIGCHDNKGTRDFVVTEWRK